MPLFDQKNKRHFHDGKLPARKRTPEGIVHSPDCGVLVGVGGLQRDEVLEEGGGGGGGAARESKTDEHRAFQMAWAVVSTRAVQALYSSFFLFLDHSVAPGGQCCRQ